MSRLKSSAAPNRQAGRNGRFSIANTKDTTAQKETMDISTSVFTDILSPLAAFSRPSPSQAAAAPENEEEAPPRPTATTSNLVWQLDGADFDGRRFFAVPTFALNAPPLRIDVYVPPLDQYPPSLLSTLRPQATFYAPAPSVPSLPIAQHLLRALESWSARLGRRFERQYSTLPFGSQVLVTNITPDPSDMRIVLSPNYDIEQAMPTLSTLQELWASHLPVESESAAWPPELDWTALRLVRQPHEAISLVRIIEGSDEIYVFKSLTRDQRYLYNELKMLLTLPAHPNLVPRPLYIVTRRGRFGGKRGVCGFILPYYALGSLKHRLLEHQLGSSSSKITPSEQFRWARQVADVFVHISSVGGTFYPDLKPDNIVLRERERGKVDAVLLDLEQRGGWFSWTPPEVAYVEYLEILAGELIAEEHKGVREEVTGLLKEYFGDEDWTPGSQRDRYWNSEGGFSAPWLALRDTTGDRWDRAQVFMLGKLLWCLFERQGLVRCGIDHEMLQEDVGDCGGDRVIGFPEFRETPEGVQRLIRACTKGAPEWEGRGRGVVLSRGKLVPVGAWMEGRAGEVTAEETRDEARRWWTKEVEKAMTFVKEVVEGRRQGRDGTQVSEVLRQAEARPGLVDVLAEIERLGSEAGIEW
ncbi:hypothetical protein B0T19DRAFT_429629 [Cercophora scortea]|uniref:Protein kinase domain-containing protein n=1 Tax=Cercophora scortea TaxID=314031 RepID=A0AAE0M5Q7_9PEZI|nr:hypothetical protein B0T19DRAFT_429629 [Cercophora scortea]